MKNNLNLKIQKELLNDTLNNTINDKSIYQNIIDRFIYKLLNTDNIKEIIDGLEYIAKLNGELVDKQEIKAEVENKVPVIEQEDLKKIIDMKQKLLEKELNVNEHIEAI